MNQATVDSRVLDVPKKSGPYPVGQPLAPGLGLLFFIAAGLCVPLYLVGTSHGQALNRSYVYELLVLTIYTSARLAVLLARRDIALIQGVFWLFVYVAFCVAPLCQVATGLYGSLISLQYLPQAVLLVLVGCVSYDLGTKIGARRLHDLKKARRQINQSMLIPLGVISVLATAYYIKTIGLSAFFSSRGSVANQFENTGLRSSTSQVGSAIVLSVGTIPILLVWVTWTLVLLGDRTRRSVGIRLWWVVLLIGNLIVNNPISNARYWFLAVLFVVLFSRVHMHPRVVRRALIVGIVAAILVFPYSDLFRRDVPGSQTIQITSVQQKLATKDYDQIDMTANGLWWVENHGFQFGKQALSDMLFFVPHTVWPGRADDTGSEIGADLPNSRVTGNNLSSPMWIEFYVDFGWIGCIFGLALFGYASRRLDDTFSLAVSGGISRFATLRMVIPVLAGFEFILLRGPLLQAMSRFAVILVVLYLLGSRSWHGFRSITRVGSRS